MEDIDKVYHFENFTHFSSAVERLKNFKYKVKLLESYETKLAETKLIKGKITGSNVYLEALENIQTKKRNTIKELLREVIIHGLNQIHLLLMNYIQYLPQKPKHGWGILRD